MIELFHDRSQMMAMLQARDEKWYPWLLMFLKMVSSTDAWISSEIHLLEPYLSFGCLSGHDTDSSSLFPSI